MTGARAPRLAQVNLVVRDMTAATAFYRLLGFAVPDAIAWPEGTDAQHVEVGTNGGFTLELDNVPMAHLWHAGVQPERIGGTAVVGLALDSREQVDELYTSVTAAGHPGRQPPYDAFWGARYAIVQDPDGYEVGLMSPIDPTRRYVPGP